MSMDKRDKKATEEKIIKAVGVLLARNGFSAIGINAIAREAGIGKTLIYRYFGGLPQLIKAYANEGEFWPKIEELIHETDEFHARSSSEKIKIMVSNYINAIKKRKLTLEILAWEMVEKNELTTILDKKRKEFLEEIHRFISASGINTKADIVTLMGIIGASINYLASRSRNCKFFNGIDLKSKEDWVKIEDTLHSIIESIVV